MRHGHLADASRGAHIQNEWTNFTAQDGGNCRIACDHYHRYPEDIQWMSKLGANAYRFGIEWARLQTAPFRAAGPVGIGALLLTCWTN